MRGNKLIPHVENNVSEIGDKSIFVADRFG